MTWAIQYYIRMCHSDSVPSEKAAIDSVVQAVLNRIRCWSRPKLRVLAGSRGNIEPKREQQHHICNPSDKGTNLASASRFSLNDLISALSSFSSIPA